MRTTVTTAAVTTKRVLSFPQKANNLKNKRSSLCASHMPSAVPNALRELTRAHTTPRTSEPIPISILYADKLKQKGEVTA